MTFWKLETKAEKVILNLNYITFSLLKNNKKHC